MQSDGTIWACNYVLGASASQDFTLYRWDSEASAPTVVYQYGLPAPGISTDRFGSGLSVFVIPGVSTNWIIGGAGGTAPASAGLLIYNSSGFTFKLLTVGNQIATPGLTIVDYNAPGFANKFRVVAKSRGTGGQIYNFDPSAASPITITSGSVAMSGGFAFIANGITSHAYDPVTRLLAGCTSTLQATPFSYSNVIFSTASGVNAPVETSRIVKTASAADGGTAGATVWGTDGRLYSTIPIASVGINAFDVTAFLVTGSGNVIGTIGDASATFTGAVFGGSDLTYQWKSNGVDIVDGTKYSGATTLSLTVSNLLIADSGTYSLYATGINSSFATASAVLTVNFGPTGPKTWNGGDADDNNWSSADNWSGSALNFAGDTAFFDGNARLTPVMDGPYDLSGMIFNAGANAFNISASSGTLTMGGGITNNAVNEQTLSLPISLSGTRAIDTAASNVVINSTISGAGGITKLGPNTLALRGTSANTFAGTLAINAGNVVFGKTPGFNAAGGTITFGTGTKLTLEASDQIPNTTLLNLQTSGGTLELLAGVTETIRGFPAGGLTVAAVSGNVELGANAQLTITPALTVGDSAVAITAASPAGTKFIVGTAGGELRWTSQFMTNTFEKLVINGGRLRCGHGGNNWSPPDTMLGAVPGAFMQDQISITNGLLGLNGLLPIPTVVVNANRGMIIAGNATNETIANVVFPGKITGPGTLYHTGGAATAPGDLELQGLNDFSGGLRLLTGAVIAGNASAAGSGPISFISNAARLAASADGITIPNHIDLSAVITNSFGYVNDFTLSGDVNLGNAGSSPQLNVTNADNTITFTGSLTNTLGLVKNGDGKVVLTGNNTYLGATTVLKGSLIVNNTSGSGTGSGAVTVSPDGTLGGTGNLAGTVTVDGTITPGNSIGTLATGDQTWNGGGRYVFEINNATGSAGTSPGWDKLTISGALNIGASAGNKFTIDITSLAGALPGDVANFNNTGTYFWTIATATSISGFDPAAFNLITTSFSNQLGIAYFDIVALGNDLVLRLLQPQPPADLVVTGPGAGTFTGSPNLTYTVQYTDSLSPVNWQLLNTVLTDGAGVGVLNDPGPLPDERYYRVIYP